MAKKKLTKSNDRVVSGVFGGLAEYFGWEKTVTRLVGAVLIVIPGNIVTGAIVYALASVIMPDKPDYGHRYKHSDDDETIIEGEFKPKDK